MVDPAANSETPSEEEEPWQMKITSLPDGIRYIYANEEFGDVVFIVGGKKFRGHRLILGARSAKFAKMLLAADPPREIKDESSKVGFEILWRFIYTDELGTTKQNEILEAYRVAKNFEQKELIEKCEELIGNMEITGDNVFTILNQVPDIALLRERCLNFVSQHSVDVIESADFLKANPNTVQDIFKHKCVGDVPIVVLQRNILRWAISQFPQEKTDPKKKKTKIYELVREHLMNIRILGKLKIHKLAADQLADFTIKYPELLTAQEYMMFNLNALKPDQNLPLPDWCDLTTDNE